MHNDRVFTYRENVHTDGSVQFDIYQRGSDRRLASAETEHSAETLCHNLNGTLYVWERQKATNTVDA